jgi:hypothetical protein
MRYKAQIATRLETAIQRVDIIDRGIESRQLTMPDLKTILEQLKNSLESAQELLELETE